MSYLSSGHRNMSEFSEQNKGGPVLGSGNYVGTIGPLSSGTEIGPVFGILLFLIGSLMTSLGFTVIGLNAVQNANVDITWQVVIASFGSFFVLSGLYLFIRNFKLSEKDSLKLIGTVVVFTGACVAVGYFWGKRIFEYKLYDKNYIEQNTQSPSMDMMTPSPMPIPNLVGVWKSPNTSVWLDIFSPTAGKEKNLNNPATEDLFEIDTDRVAILSRRDPVRNVDFTFTYKDGRLANAVNYKFDTVDGSLTNLMTSEKFTRVAS